MPKETQTESDGKMSCFWSEFIITSKNLAIKHGSGRADEKFIG